MLRNDAKHDYRKTLAKCLHKVFKHEKIKSKNTKHDAAKALHTQDTRKYQLKKREMRS